MIKKYKDYIKESLLTKLEGPTEEEFWNSLLNKYNNYEDIIFAAARANYVDGVKISLEILNKEGNAVFNLVNKLLNDTITYGCIDVLKYLIEEEGASVDGYYGLNLEIAVSNNQPEIIKYLLSKGADVNINNRAPLWKAMSKGYVECAKELLKGGVKLEPYMIGVVDKKNKPMLDLLSKYVVQESILNKLEGPSIDEIFKSINKKFMNGELSIPDYVNICKDYGFEISDSVFDVLKKLNRIEKICQSTQVDYVPGFIDAIEDGIKLNKKYSFDWKHKNTYSGAYVTPIILVIMLNAENIFDYIVSNYPDKISDKVLEYTFTSNKPKFFEKILQAGIIEYNDLNIEIKSQIRKHPKKLKEFNKILNKYNNANESLLNKLEGPNEEEFIKYLDSLGNTKKIKKIITLGEEYYKYLPDILIVDGDLDLHSLRVEKLPDNLTIKGDLDCGVCHLSFLPRNLKVGGTLYCHHNFLTELPDDLEVGGSICCSNNELTSLPDNLTVNGWMDCGFNKLTKLPENLTVNGEFWCGKNALPLKIPASAKIKGEMHD